MVSEPPGHDPLFHYSSYDYINQMLDYGIHPDAVGIQFYFGSNQPSIDLGTVSDLLDLYGRPPLQIRLAVGETVVVALYTDNMPIATGCQD